MRAAALRALRPIARRRRHGETSDSASLIGGDLAEAVTELKQRPGKNIGVHGSPTLVEALLHADLLDEMRLEIYPVVAGTGARLFMDGNAPTR